MANPVYDQKSIKKMKAPGAAIVEKDSARLVEGIGTHNASAPNLADGDFSPLQLDDMANLKIAFGDPSQLYEMAYSALPGVNKSYEGTLIVGDSPLSIDFNADTGRNSLDGWITCDGPGDIQLRFSQNGTVYGDVWTMKPGENTGVRGFDIDTLELIHTGTDSAYRIVLL